MAISGKLVALVELSDRANGELRYLSRGMQQKVTLATAILHDADVLLLDGPTLGLNEQELRTIEEVAPQFNQHALLDGNNLEDRLRLGLPHD
jgi:ABC-2 type transport system ATP-binding protein